MRVLSQLAVQNAQQRLQSALGLPVSFVPDIPKKVQLRNGSSKNTTFFDNLSIHSFCKRTIEISALSRLCIDTLGKAVMKALVDICYHDIKVRIFLS